MNKTSDLLLPEDQLLLDQYKKIGPLSTGKALEEQKRKMAMIQTEAILRSRKSASDTNKSNDRATRIVLGFALIQIVIPLIQLSFELIPPTGTIQQIVKIVFFGIALMYMIHSITKDA